MIHTIRFQRQAVYPLEGINLHIPTVNELERKGFLGVTRQVLPDGVWLYSLEADEDSYYPFHRALCDLAMGKEQT